MPAKYRVHTDGGTFEVTTDEPGGGDPSTAEGILANQGIGPLTQPNPAAKVKSQMLNWEDNPLTGVPSKYENQVDTFGQFDYGQIGEGIKSLGSPLAERKAHGVSQLARGIGSGLAVPGALAGALTNPVGTAAMFARGAVAQPFVEGGARMVGVPEGYSEVGGDLAGLAAMGRPGEAVQQKLGSAGSKVLNSGPAIKAAWNAAKGDLGVGGATMASGLAAGAAAHGMGIPYAPAAISAVATLPAGRIIARGLGKGLEAARAEMARPSRQPGAYLKKAAPVEQSSPRPRPMATPTPSPTEPPPFDWEKAVREAPRRKGLSFADIPDEPEAPVPQRVSLADQYGAQPSPRPKPARVEPITPTVQNGVNPWFPHEKEPITPAPLAVKESPTAAAQRQEFGQQIVDIDPAKFQAEFERTHGEPLAKVPEKTAALQGLGEVDEHPLVTHAEGRPDVQDGRHRIAEAAARGQATFPVRVEAGTELPESIQPPKLSRAEIERQLADEGLANGTFKPSNIRGMEPEPAALPDNGWPSSKVFADSERTTKKAPDLGMMGAELGWDPQVLRDVAERMETDPAYKIPPEVVAQIQGSRGVKYQHISAQTLREAADSLESRQAPKQTAAPAKKPGKFGSERGSFSMKPITILRYSSATNKAGLLKEIENAASRDHGARETYGGLSVALENGQDFDVSNLLPKYVIDQMKQRSLIGNRPLLTPDLAHEHTPSSLAATLRTGGLGEKRTMWRFKVDPSEIIGLSDRYTPGYPPSYVADGLIMRPGAKVQEIEKVNPK